MLKAILTILAATIVATLIVLLCTKSRPTKIKRNELESTYVHLSHLSKACGEFREKVGYWPTTFKMLTNAVPIADTQIILDGWGHEITFRTATNSPKIMWLISYGADGVPGGFDLDADIIHLVNADYKFSFWPLLRN